MTDQALPEAGGRPLDVDALLSPSPEAREAYDEAYAARECAEVLKFWMQNARNADGGRGLSQAEMARRLGVSQPRISKLLNPNTGRGPSYALMQRACTACGFPWPLGMAEALAAIQAGAKLRSADEARDITFAEVTSRAVAPGRAAMPIDLAIAALIEGESAALAAHVDEQAVQDALAEIVHIEPHAPRHFNIAEVYAAVSGDRTDDRFFGAVMNILGSPVLSAVSAVTTASAALSALTRLVPGDDGGESQDR